MVILFTTVTLHAFKENNKTHVMMLEGVYDVFTLNENLFAIFIDDVTFLHPHRCLASAISFYLIRIFVSSFRREDYEYFVRNSLVVFQLTPSYFHVLKSITSVNFYVLWNYKQSITL